MAWTDQDSLLLLAAWARTFQRLGRIEVGFGSGLVNDRLSELIDDQNPHR